MPIDINRAHRALDKLGQQFAKVRKRATPAAVHKLRTASRRVETLLREVVPQPDRNDKKLLKLLAKIRAQAGKVRDLDVQIRALQALSIDGAHDDKTRLSEALARKRMRSQKELSRTCDRKMGKEIRRRADRAASQFDGLRDVVPLDLAMNRLAELRGSHFPLSEKNLHRYRVVGKRARYIAEFDSSDRQARELVHQLKSVQDVIGDWHDGLKMAQRARKILGGSRQSALVAKLQDLTRTKYRAALDAVAEMRSHFAQPAAALAPKREAASPPSSRAVAVS
jgi:CHAD domain-containing protein